VFELKVFQLKSHAPVGPMGVFKVRDVGRPRFGDY
jgi:hypothetical protein